MDAIYEGTLQSNGQAFYVRRLTLNDLDKLMFLQEKVIGSLEDKSVLQPLSREEFRYILEGNGLLVGAFTDTDFIAFRALLVPPIDEEHLGWDIGLTREELASVIYQEISNVHPDYRGNGLQKQLAFLIMEELKKIDQAYKYVCCTVAPFNMPSLKDKFAQGMEIAALKDKYDGMLRYIFVKKLAENQPRAYEHVQALKMEDISGQQALLEKGWRGFRMYEQEGVPVVDYGK